MIRNLRQRKIVNYILNPNLINFDNIVDKKFNHNYQTNRYDHTHSKTIFPNQDSDTNKYNDNKLLKLNLHEQLYSNKILSNNEFDKKVRSIVQEELKKINHNIDTDKDTNTDTYTNTYTDTYTDTKKNNLDKTYFISNDNDLEKKIKNIVALEIDKIKESISDTNTPIQPVQQTITQPVQQTITQPVQQTITHPDQKVYSFTIFIICFNILGISYILLYTFGFPGLIIIYFVSMFIILSHP